MRILLLSRWFPYPADNGSKIRIYHLIKQLSKWHDISLLAFAAQPVSAEHREALREYCAEVYHTPYPSNPIANWATRLSWLSSKPRSLVNHSSTEFAGLVRQLCRRTSYDVVVASQIDMMPYLELVPNLPRIIEEVELTGLYDRFVKQRNLIKRARYGLTWWKLSRYIRHVVEDSDGCTVVSPREQALLGRLVRAPDKVELIPNGVDTVGMKPGASSPKPYTLIYTGALSYGPNYDGIDFFLRDVFPRVLAQRPQTTLTVTGSLEDVRVAELPQCRNVIFTGYLPSVHAHIARSWASVVPLRVGGGTRLKVLESLALGTPVISTTKGVEGLALARGQEVLIADEPAHFADTVLRLLDDPHLRSRLCHSGRQAVEARYNWIQIAQRMNSFLERQVAMCPKRALIPPAQHAAK